jgi:hypothetical protein
MRLPMIPYIFSYNSLWYGLATCLITFSGTYTEANKEGTEGLGVKGVLLRETPDYSGELRG